MRPTLLPSLLLVLLTALAFWPVRTATFLRYDDPLHVTGNVYILPPTPARLAYFWRYPLDPSPVPGVTSTAGQLKSPYQQIYSPLAFTMWGLLVYPARIAPLPTPDDPVAQSEQQQKISLDPAIYHSFNLLLHVLNVLLVFALLRHFVKKEWAAVLGASLFAVHPVQVEPVAWVTGMNNLLSGFFALAALLLYLKNKDEGETPRWKKGAYWGSTFCFLLSVLSKPSSVTLPAIALILCWALGEKRWRLRFMEMIPWSVVALFCIGMNKIVQGNDDIGLPAMSWQKFFLIGDSLTFYLSKLLLPWNLVPDYGRRPEWVMQQSLTYILWLLPVGISLFAWLWWKRSLRQKKENDVARMLLACIALFVVMLLPSSGLITYYFQLISTVADRYMYMALIGPAILVAVLASWGSELKKGRVRVLLGGLGLGMVAILTVLSFRQTQLWQTDTTLWTHNIAVNPQSTVAYYQYGVALYNKHDYKGAVDIFKKGLAVTPNNWMINLELGNSYFRLREYAKSEDYLRRTLEISKDSLNAHLSLGVLLAEKGNLDEAIDQFHQGLQLQPQNPLLLSYMGLNLTKMGRSDVGATFIKEAIKYGFDPVKGHLFLGNALARSGKIPEAMAEWNLAMEYDPNYYEPYYNLGVTTAKLGNTTLAIKFLERTTQLKPSFAPAYIQLGQQWLKLGQKEKAKANFRAALQIDPRNSLALRALGTMK